MAKVKNPSAGVEPAEGLVNEGLGISEPNGSEGDRKPATTLRITGGANGTNRCTLSAVQRGTVIVVKFSAQAAEAVKAEGLTHVIPEWRSDGNGDVALSLTKPQANERGFIVGSARRMRLHVQFPAKGVELAKRQIVVDEPTTGVEGAIFAIPAGDVKLPA